MTGLPFRELLAGYATRLYASGNGVAGHSRFNFTFSGLGSPESRGFPQPATLKISDGLAPSGRIQLRGVAFVEVQGSFVRMETSADAELSAVLLPDGYTASVEIPTDHSSGLLFEPQLSGILTVGVPVVIQGRVLDPSIRQVTAQYSSAADVLASFPITVDDDGRFTRTVVFDHGQTGDVELEVFVDSDFSGDFEPLRILPAAELSAAITLPRRFFDKVLLDSPRPTVWRAARKRRYQAASIFSSPPMPACSHSICRWKHRLRETGSCAYSPASVVTSRFVAVLP